jgi:hypothetical protein
MQRFVPLLVVFILLLIIAGIYGPGWYRGLLFQRAVESMLTAARAGNTQGIASACLSAQQADALSILSQYLPSDYASKIARLSLASSEPGEDGARYAIVNCRIEAGDGIIIYSGKLRWVWSGTRWDWDFFGSYAAPFQPAGEVRWIKLDEVLPEASAL